MVDLLRAQVKHAMLGIGTVTQQDANYITVQFVNKTSRFAYPAAFETYLVPEDPNLEHAIRAEIDAAKAAEAAREAAGSARILEEERARLTTTQESFAAPPLPSTAKAIASPQRIANRALPFLVFQGTTYREECAGEFIWAPKYTKDGKTMHHWDRLMNLRRDDVIFHCSDGYIQAISRVKGPCIDSARPDHTTGDWTSWEKDGRRVDCEYHTLRVPLKHSAYKSVILPFCQVKYAPFDKNGNGNLGYLFDLQPQLAAFFVQEIAKRNPEISQLDFLRFLFAE